MRENKCRGKYLDGKGWVFGDYFRKQITDKRGEGLRHYIGWQVTDEKGVIWNEYEEVDPATTGQFTGLLHEGRTEVYDDDVFREWLEDKVHPEGGIWVFLVVKWVEGKYILEETQFDYKGDYSDCGLLADELKRGTLEYIGPIHDHPELRNKNN